MRKIQQKWVQHSVLCILIIIFFVPVTITIQATSSEFNFLSEAQKLKELGIFKGTQAGFELERNATRAEAAVILVRLLGAEDIALANNYSHPFVDVPDWVSPYIGYLYKMNLTQGIDAKHYGCQLKITQEAFLTFCLRSLNYSDTHGDFYWNAASFKAVEIGLIDEQFQTNLRSENEITRDSICGILYNMLNQKNKEFTSTLIQTLISKGVIIQIEAIEQGMYILPTTLQYSGKIVSINNTSKFVAFAQRNEVDYITFIPFGGVEKAYTTSLLLLTDEGKTISVCFSKEYSIDQVQPLDLKINEHIAITGNLVIEFPKKDNQVISLVTSEITLLGQ